MLGDEDLLFEIHPVAARAGADVGLDRHALCRYGTDLTIAERQEGWRT